MGRNRKELSKNTTTLKPFLNVRSAIWINLLHFIYLFLFFFFRSPSLNHTLFVHLLIPNAWYAPLEYAHFKSIISSQSWFRPKYIKLSRIIYTLYIDIDYMNQLSILCSITDHIFSNFHISNFLSYCLSTSLFSLPLSLTIYFPIVSFAHAHWRLNIQTGTSANLTVVR